ncbi:hypothetical protein BX283_7711 [Streptomyces sp. TLI_146]|nr:hypothetical protein BX283_7711 [Streptomyces sp. TLI_146]
MKPGPLLTRAARRRVRVVNAAFQAPLPRPAPFAAPPARLTLKPDGPSRGLLDGAWWPRSRDRPCELPALTDVLDTVWGRITRIAVNPEHWPVIPRRVPHLPRPGSTPASRAIGTGPESQRATRWCMSPTATGSARCSRRTR